jgi:hypothetical protein
MTAQNVDFVDSHLEKQHSKSRKECVRRTGNRNAARSARRMLGDTSEVIERVIRSHLPIWRDQVGFYGERLDSAGNSRVETEA